MQANSLEIEGLLVERSPRRLTPAGVPVVEGVLEHCSSVAEAGVEREIRATVPFVAVGDNALPLTDAPLGLRVKASGFIAAKSLKNGRLVLHVTELRFVEGN